jgi:hypothetical protein
MRNARILLVVAVWTALLLGLGHSTALALALTNQALQFDGVDDIVLVTENSTLDFTNQVTVETWVKLDSRGLVGNQLAVGKRAAYVIYCETNTMGGTGNWKGQVWRPDLTDLFGSTNLLTDAWYHLALTYDGTRMRVFVNGSQENERACTNALGTSNYNLCFGKESSTSMYALHGQLDEVRIWSIARTPEEIAANYNRPVDPSTPGLAGYWNFDEGDGQIVYDLTSNENHGFLGETPYAAADDPLRVASDAPIVPEPSTVVLLLSAAAVLVVCRRR